MLTTQRLILKPGVLSDAPHLLDLNSDPEVVRYTGNARMLNLMDAEAVIKEKQIPDFEQYKMSRFSVFSKEGTYLGWCGLKYFPQTKEVDLGYRFKKSFWGKGFATEASRACLEYGFEKLQLPLIIAKAMPDNIGSIK